MPPDLSQLPRDERFLVPERPQTITASGQQQAGRPAGGAVPAAATSAVVPGGVVAKIERQGNQRWLAVNLPPERVWPVLVDFWPTVGLQVEKSDAGAPFVDGRALAAELGGYGLPGVVFRSCVFQPTFDKHTGKLCGAVQIHVSDRDTFDSYRAGLAVLVAIKRLYPKDFTWRKTTYEFRDDVPAIDLLTGKPAVRAAIDAGGDLDAVAAAARGGLELYEAGRAAALLYD